MQHLSHKIFLLFAVLFIITVPFPHHYIPDIGQLLHPFSEGLVKWTAHYIFNIKHSYISQLVSDSTGLYIHVFNLFIIAIPTAILLNQLLKDKLRLQIFEWCRLIIIYFLSLQLFEYGFSKVFKWQFYLPEPNTLFTTVGNTYQDLMYWTTMGASRSYTMFTGIAELIAASLLLFRRTRLTGALLTFFIMINVVAINLSYDISVKILSSFLLLLSMLIILPKAKNIAALLFEFPLENKLVSNVNFTITKSKWLYISLKTFVITYILLSILSPYFSAHNFNDDTAARPLFHGAYDVPIFVRNNDTIPPLMNTMRWKRAFVHRRGYFITQDMYDDMQDYTLLTDTINHHFILTNETDNQVIKFNYVRPTDSTLQLSGIIDNDTLSIMLKQIDIKDLPALKHEFHWTSDNL